MKKIKPFSISMDPSTIMYQISLLNRKYLALKFHFNEKLQFHYANKLLFVGKFLAQ